MKIILNQDVYNLGEEGDVCAVTNGYGRNFLIPQKMAVLFNKQNSAIFESRKAAIEKRKEEKRMASAGLKEKVEAVTLELKVSTGDTGKLFGSVTNAKIAEELKKEGIIIERKKIELPEHTIKTIGEFTAKIKLYGNESADLKIIIKSDKKITEAVKVEKPAAKEVKDAETPQEEEVVEAVKAKKTASKKVKEVETSREEEVVEAVKAKKTASKKVKEVETPVEEEVVEAVKAKKTASKKVKEVETPGDEEVVEAVKAKKTASKKVKEVKTPKEEEVVEAPKAEKPAAKEVKDVETAPVKEVTEAVKTEKSAVKAEETDAPVEKTETEVSESVDDA